MRRPAFTVIEVLVVVAIIALLSALTVAAANAIGIGSKKARSGAIIAAVRKGLELTLANKGGQIAPAEHPLAGSQAPRHLFQRGASPLPTAGEALVAPPLDQIAAGERGRLLLAEDVYADPDLPLLFGLPRGWCTIIGTPLATVTSVRRLPILPPPATTAAGLQIRRANDHDDAGGVPDGVLDTPYDSSSYPDALFKPPVTGDAGTQKAAIDYLFGSSTVQSELAAMKALASAPGATFTHALQSAKAIGTTASGPLTRVYSDIPTSGAGVARWKPGRYRDGNIPSGSDAGKPNWKPYRLTGLAVYDAWNRELLYSVSASGAIRLVSAGGDGVFRWHPGNDGTFATAAEATAAAGDDRDGARDNVRQEVAE